MNKNTGKWYGAEGNQKPERINGQIATRTAFYRRELQKVVKSIFKVKLPNYNWDLDYILNTLIYSGYIVISRTKDYGILPIRGSLTGYNYIGYPTKAVMASPIIGNWENTIGVDCELIYLERSYQKNFYTFRDLIQITAEKLATADASININMLNSRMAYAAIAETKAEEESIKVAYDQVSEGNPLVIRRGNGSLSKNGYGLELFFGNVKQNYVADMVQDTKRSIVNEFLTSLGINNANTDKRERLVTEEVKANNGELIANTDIWKENLRIQVKKLKHIFPELDFDIHYNDNIVVNNVGGINATTQHNKNVGNSASR